MTSPSSTPRGEHTPRPGVTWQTTLAHTEHVIPDNAPDPQPNRATRRALKRAAVTSVAPCSSKGRPGSVRVVKGGQYECTRCGRRWPMTQGSTHPA